MSKKTVKIVKIMFRSGQSIVVHVGEDEFNGMTYAYREFLENGTCKVFEVSTSNGCGLISTAEIEGLLYE